MVTCPNPTPGCYITPVRPGVCERIFKRVSYSIATKDAWPLNLILLGRRTKGEEVEREERRRCKKKGGRMEGKEGEGGEEEKTG